MTSLGVLTIIYLLGSRYQYKWPPTLRDSIYVQILSVQYGYRDTPPFVRISRPCTDIETPVILISRLFRYPNKAEGLNICTYRYQDPLLYGFWDPSVLGYFVNKLCFIESFLNNFAKINCFANLTLNNKEYNCLFGLQLIVDNWAVYLERKEKKCEKKRI